jgi:tetratricopeptide (TPR) repeat protein
MTLNYGEKALLRANMAADQDDWARTLAYADEALQHDNRCVEAYFLAGRALFNIKQPALATQLFHIATKLEPDFAEAWNNLGVTLQDRDDEGAYRAFRKAYEIKPKLVAALASLCAVSHGLGRYDEAMSWADLCLREDPQNKDVLYNSSLTLLAQGEWAKAWPRYNITLGIKDRNVRNFHGARPTPRWNPKLSPNAKVCIYGEQGIGDEIMFASMIPDAIATGAKIVLETDRRLEGLYKRSFPEATVYPTRGQHVCEWVADERIEARLEAGGLGEYFAPEPRWSGGYLKACPAKRAMVRAWLDSVSPPTTLGKPLRVGIAWTGGTWSTGRRIRSLPLEALTPLLSAHGVEFVCLEYDDPRDDLAALEAAHPAIRIHDPRSLVSRQADYDDTAALVSELDLIIAPTTSVVDLAGALGRLVWAFAPTRPQWRYSDAAGPERMFWYESARVFRQKEPGSWGAPVAQAAKALRELTGERCAA